MLDGKKEKAHLEWNRKRLQLFLYTNEMKFFGVMLLRKKGTLGEFDKLCLFMSELAGTVVRTCGYSVRQVWL